MEIPITAEELIRNLDEAFPSRTLRATDFETEEAKARMIMYAGKRELVEMLVESLNESTEQLPRMN